jgi:hypothetical protein
LYRGVAALAAEEIRGVQPGKLTCLAANSLPIVSVGRPAE